MKLARLEVPLNLPSNNTSCTATVTLYVIPYMKKQQAHPCDHSIKKISHFHDHRVCVTQARVYAKPVDLRLEVQ